MHLRSKDQLFIIPRKNYLTFQSLLLWMKGSSNFFCAMSDPLPPLAFEAQTVRNGASSHKIDYVAHVSDILNLKGYQNYILGSKATTF